MAIPIWLFSLPLQTIYRHANQAGLDPLLVAAIIKVESGGVSGCTRLEPQFKHFFKIEEYSNKLGITPITEASHQQTSWGPMQVMGSVARELGFEGHMPMLCETELGIKFGVLKLKQLWTRWGGKIDDVVAAYNAGSPIKDDTGHYKNNKYVIKVMTYYNELRGV